MKSKRHIGILGCGWLGKATAKALIKKGYKVKGSITTPEGVEALKSLGIKPYIINLTTRYPIANLEDFISDIGVLIIAVPPKIREPENTLLEAFRLMFKTYKFSKLEKLIYVSSTGVFEDAVEAIYDETSPPNKTTTRGQSLIALEHLILEQKQIKQCLVLRYGGLIKNGGRHPIHYLKAKKEVPNPNAPVNLIEQTDAVNLLCTMIENPCHLKFYHGVHPAHPSRKEYYTQKANELHLVPPQFDDEKQSVGKTILSHNTQVDLGFKFESNI